ncbi:hypothetical protein EV13_0283 [Prochlorococcus sp. MIT 0702]|nr:hypothetical protein EV12_1279 [Prochlorococcus sp. MIT 0701]KGG30407.1 hypothetical protein EV13_0283 [Prochlorococcus sp. MIT 0702]KGG36543.1 hypothetical protein EV14_0276 [Prochlorococcus sp. MIT 0703]
MIDLPNPFLKSFRLRLFLQGCADQRMSLHSVCAQILWFSHLAA